MQDPAAATERMEERFFVGAHVLARREMKVPAVVSSMMFMTYGNC